MRAWELRVGVRTRLLLAVVGAVSLALLIGVAAFNLLLDQRLTDSEIAVARGQAAAESSTLRVIGAVRRLALALGLSLGAAQAGAATLTEAAAPGGAFSAAWDHPTEIGAGFDAVTGTGNQNVYDNLLFTALPAGAQRLTLHLLRPRRYRLFLLGRRHGLLQRHAVQDRLGLVRSLPGRCRSATGTRSRRSISTSPTASRGSSTSRSTSPTAPTSATRSPAPSQRAAGPAAPSRRCRCRPACC